MEHSIFLTGCYCFLSLFAVLIFIFWLIWRRGKYNADCANIAKDIKELPVTSENYDLIRSKLKNLKRFGSRRSKQELSKSFFFKFRAEATRRVQEKMKLKS
jgi:hypothetical protein